MKHARPARTQQHRAYRRRPIDYREKTCEMLMRVEDPKICRMLYTAVCSVIGVMTEQTKKDY